MTQQPHFSFGYPQSPQGVPSAPGQAGPQFGGSPPPQAPPSSLFSPGFGQQQQQQQLGAFPSPVAAPGGFTSPMFGTPPPNAFGAQTQSGFSTPTGYTSPTASAFAVPHGRKRGADSPPTDTTSTIPRGPDAKRRRPNLSNGFQAMSINTANADAFPGKWNPVAFNAAPGDDDDYDGLEPTQLPLAGDVGVEVLPERSPRHKRPRAWHRTSSFSSASPSEGDYESDATFRVPTRPCPTVQASSVEHPPDTPSLASATERFGPHVELLDTPIKRKQAPDEQQPRKRRREMDMDMDLPMDLPEGSYGPGWYEPEKDRIVVTSLSSPESSPPPQGARISRAHSRDASPDPASDKPYSFTENRHLSQPGSQGFTISPSLLTHILNAQREQLPFDVNAHTAPERGLVLYRPVPGMGRPVVEEWNDANHVPLDDSGRFEEVDDDEELTTGQQQDANMDMDEETPWQYAEEAMDIE